MYVRPVGWQANGCCQRRPSCEGGSFMERVVARLAYWARMGQLV